MLSGRGTIPLWGGSPLAEAYNKDLLKKAGKLGKPGGYLASQKQIPEHVLLLRTNTHAGQTGTLESSHY